MFAKVGTATLGRQFSSGQLRSSSILRISHSRSLPRVSRAALWAQGTINLTAPQLPTQCLALGRY